MSITRVKADLGIVHVWESELNELEKKYEKVLIENGELRQDLEDSIDAADAVTTYWPNFWTLVGLGVMCFLICAGFGRCTYLIQSDDPPVVLNIK